MAGPYCKPLSPKVMQGHPKWRGSAEVGPGHAFIKRVRLGPAGQPPVFELVLPPLPPAPAAGGGGAAAAEEV